jgi:zinc transport system substrate-binding protein
MKHPFLKVSFLFLVSLIIVSCGSEKKQTQEETALSKPLVAVVNYPLYSFASQIGGDKVEVFFPNIDGDPAYWQPDEASIEKFQNADLILLNGAHYAKWTEKVSLPAATQVNTANAFSDQLIEIKGEVHSHGPEGEHNHTGYAFTTWLDLKNAIKHAEAVKIALGELIAEEKETFNANFKEIQDQLIQLDEQLSDILGSQENLELFASHPVYQYLEKGYDVQVINYHWEPDQMPSEVEWKEFENELDHHSARAMLWEDEHLEEIRIKLEGLGVKTIVFNPGGNRTESEFISLMQQNVENLKNGLN